jgi:hypothetical protein
VIRIEIVDTSSSGSEENVVEPPGMSFFTSSQAVDSMLVPYQQPRPARLYNEDDAATLSFPKPGVVEEDNGMVVEEPPVDNNEESAHERMACLAVCLFECVVVAADAYR